MAIKNIEIQDHLGNVYHPHTSANVVFMENGKSVQSVVGGGLTDTNINITDKNNHFVATKLDGALDELFTFADNGKKGIATVIGSPLTSGDTFGEQKNKITNLKYTFSKNLRNKGMDADYLSDTLKNMIDKVEDIRALPKLPQWFNDSNTYTFTNTFLPKDITLGLRAFYYERDRTILILAESSSSTIGNHVYKYDIDSTKITDCTRMPHNRSYFGGGIVNDKLYIFGEYGRNHCFDIRNNSWSEITANPIGSRVKFGYCVINNKIYLIGGRSKSCYRYDPLTDTASEISELPRSSEYSCVAVNSKIYAFCSEMTYYNGEGYVYDSLTDTWSPLPINPSKRHQEFCIERVGDYIYLIGGTVSSPYESLGVDVYDIKNNSWQNDVSTLPYARTIYHGFGICNADDIIYIMGGSNGGNNIYGILCYIP